MARYVTQFNSPFTPQQINDAAAAYLTNEGFEFREFDTQNVWKKGKGIMTAPQFIRISQSAPGVYTLEAWLKYPILPGVYVGELGIDGFFAAVPKSMLKSRVTELLACLTGLNQQSVYNNAPAQQNAPVQNNAQNAQQGTQQ